MRGGRERAVTTKHSHSIIPSTCFRCVYFLIKSRKLPQRKKMTINHPEPSSAKGRARERERESEVRERDTPRDPRQTEGAVLSNTFNAWIYHEKEKKNTDIKKEA